MGRTFPNQTVVAVIIALRPLLFPNAEGRNAEHVVKQAA